MQRWAAVWGCVGAMSCGLFEPRRLVQFTELDAGGLYTCALDDRGQAYCWGGVDGYFGNAPHPDSVPPTSAIPLLVPKSAALVGLTAGGGNKCALDTGRRGYCWGANQLGEAGDGSLVAKLSPSAVTGELTWRAISSGGLHTCGVSEAQVAYCWGNGFRGALGNGSKEFLAWSVPVLVQGGLSWDSVYASAASSCGITNTGSAYCWGFNKNGSLGNGVVSGDVAEPSAVTGGLTFVSLAVGAGHACGISETRTIYCWGTNTTGQLGTGTLVSTASPAPVSLNQGWVQLALGDEHSCALAGDGAVYCWGANDRGQLGNGTSAPSSIPKQVTSTVAFTTITAGAHHTCGLASTGIAYCWGRGTNGQLGNGTFEDADIPVPVILPRR